MEMINEIAAKHGVIQDIYLRLTPGIEAHTHEYIQTGQIDSKFGFAPVRVPIVLTKVLNQNLKELAFLMAKAFRKLYKIKKAITGLVH